MIAAVSLFGLYAVAWRRQPPAHRRATHLLFAGLGCLMLAAAFAPVTESAAASSFTGHMVQHLLLLFAVPPLLALALPLTVTARAAGWRLPHHRSGAGAIGLGAAAVGLVLVVFHLPAVYDAAVRAEPLHAASHLAYLVAGCLYWWPVLARDRIAFSPGHGARILAVVALPPLMALLAAVIGSADHVLYVSLATSTADQERGAALMWLGPMVVWLPALLWLVLDWARAEESAERRLGSVPVTVH